MEYPYALMERAMKGVGAAQIAVEMQSHAFLSGKKRGRGKGPTKNLNKKSRVSMSFFYSSSFYSSSTSTDSL